jgi:hypothetical protein
MNAAHSKCPAGHYVTLRVVTDIGAFLWHFSGSAASLQKNGGGGLRHTNIL